MVAHPHELILPREVAARVGALGSVTAVSNEILPVRLDGRTAAFSDVSEPTEVYDLRLAGCSLGQLIHDGTRLRGLGCSHGCWVLSQKDADLVLAASSFDEAVARASRMLAERLPSLPVRRDSVQGGRSVLRTAVPAIAAGVAGVVVLLRLRARTARRRHG